MKAQKLLSACRLINTADSIDSHVSALIEKAFPAGSHQLKLKNGYNVSTTKLFKEVCVLHALSSKNTNWGRSVVDEVVSLREYRDLLQAEALYMMGINSDEMSAREVVALLAIRRQSMTTALRWSQLLDLEIQHLVNPQPFEGLKPVTKWAVNCPDEDQEDPEDPVDPSFRY